MGMCSLIKSSSANLSKQKHNQRSMWESLLAWLQQWDLIFSPTQVWKLDNFSHVSTLHAHDNPVSTLAVGGEFLFSGSLNIVKVTHKLRNSLGQKR